MEMMRHIKICASSQYSGTTLTMNQTNLRCSIYTTATLITHYLWYI